MTAFQKAALAILAACGLLVALAVMTRAPWGGAPSGGSLSGGSPAAADLAFAGAQPPGINATGEATVKVQPDIAVLSVGVTTQAATAAAAQNTLNERIARVLQKAKDLRIPDADVKTAGYSISPQYDTRAQAQSIVGYQAIQSLTVTLRGTAGVGTALDAFVQGDAATNVQVRFALESPKAKQAEARRLAIDNARAKAQAMADAAGVRLGKLVSISESSSGPGPIYDTSVLKGGLGVAPAASVPVGDLDVSVNVSVRYAIE